jgi:hypothetical protein
MLPTLSDEDWVVYHDKWITGALRHQVVVCEHPYENTLIVKRVDHLSEDGRVFLVGDSPHDSTDSRSFGTVSLHKIKGVVCCYHTRSDSQ